MNGSLAILNQLCLKHLVFPAMEFLGVHFRLKESYMIFFLFISGLSMCSGTSRGINGSE